MQVGDLIQPIESCFHGQGKCVANPLQRLLLEASPDIIYVSAVLKWYDTTLYYHTLLSGGILQQIHDSVHVFSVFTDNMFKNNWRQTTGPDKGPLFYHNRISILIIWMCPFLVLDNFLCRCYSTVHFLQKKMYINMLFKHTSKIALLNFGYLYAETLNFLFLFHLGKKIYRNITQDWFMYLQLFWRDEFL